MDWRGNHNLVEPDWEYPLMINLDSISDEARDAGVSEREYCLMQIRLLKEHLYKISDDYRDLEQEEFEVRVENEVEEFRVYTSHEDR